MILARKVTKSAVSTNGPIMINITKFISLSASSNQYLVAGAARWPGGERKQFY